MLLFDTVITVETAHRYFLCSSPEVLKYKKTSVFVQTPNSVSNNEPFSVYGLPHQIVLTEGDENRPPCSEFVWALIVCVA
jgi:hypothetical protein